METTNRCDPVPLFSNLNPYLVTDSTHTGCRWVLPKTRNEWRRIPHTRATKPKEAEIIWISVSHESDNVMLIWVKLTNKCWTYQLINSMIIYLNNYLLCSDYLQMLSGLRYRKCIRRCRQMKVKAPDETQRKRISADWTWCWLWEGRRTIQLPPFNNRNGAELKEAVMWSAKINSEREP